MCLSLVHSKRLSHLKTDKSAVSPCDGPIQIQLQVHTLDLIGPLPLFFMYPDALIQQWCLQFLLSKPVFEENKKMTFTEKMFNG